MGIKILVGDCRQRLKELPEQSVHCVVTSPPYFGLRDYGTGQWEGGDPACDHRPSSTPAMRGLASSTLQGSKDTQGHQQAGYGSTCPRCGASRIDAQVGQEDTPEAFVQALVEVMREVRRVLRDDGTLWLNLGDSYTGSGRGPTGKSGFGDHEERQGFHTADKREYGLGPKQLLGIPWRVAFALQADGWVLRQDIIWHKPTTMPESVADRCTKAHEYIFLLTKQPRYFYNADAIKTPWVENEADKKRAEAGHDGYDAKHGDGYNGVRGQPVGDPSKGANKRSVWSVVPARYAEAHFATYPPELIEPCILAGCPEDGTVLDPFGGAGTTGLVADRLRRNAILCELNPEYAELARSRLMADGGMFMSVDMVK